jgi:Na+-translocating ferredoxin:NAD+ oxidoreductase RNF subunit RnfB
MDSLVYTLISLGSIGFILGAGLAFASKRFAIKVNPLVEKVLEVLPGANCGGCGYAGCAVYAEVLVNNGIEATLCAPGGPDVVLKLSKLLDREAKTSVRKVAYLLCAGTKEKARNKYVYDGLKDCQTAVLLSGGPKACEFGCIGFGTCVEACKFDALHMSEGGLPVVDRKKCTACGACVKACPEKLFTLLPDMMTIYLACSSHDNGKAVKDVCSVGCIGCGLCIKITEGSMIQMVDNLPSIDYDLSPNLILAHYKCPTKSFVDLMPKRPHMNIDSKCKGHGKCMEVCPVKDCIPGEPGQQHTIDPKKCIGCGLCLGVCPVKAIHVVGAMGYIGMDRMLS